MRIKKQDELLDQDTRATIIKDILGGENQARKEKAYKRYLCYKDRTKDFVLENIKKQFDASTVDEMSYCIANVSFVKKVVEKLARVYSNGVDRKIEGSDEQTKTLQTLGKKLNFDTELKKTNKYLKLQRNVALYVKPCPIETAQGEKWKVKVEALSPYLYDVIEDFYDPTQPMAYVLSNFSYSGTPLQVTAGVDLATAGRSTPISPAPANTGNGKDEAIADDPLDKDDREFIWWSAKYHFTTNVKGEVISKKEDGTQSTENPIGELPIENFALEQDGCFWAEGGDDLIDAGVLINSVITHNEHIAVTQGYGQMWMSGKSVPTHVKIGPNKLIRMEYKEGDPVPELGFASASPQLDSMRALVEQYVALMLTTNNLSTSAVSTQLSGGSSAPSGVAMLIDKAESIEDVSEQRQVFVDKEPSIWRKISKWITFLNDKLIDELKTLKLDESSLEKFTIKFHEQQVIMSESEKLENLKKRKDLGLNTQIELLMKDDPSLTEEQAKQRLKAILEEKIQILSDEMEAQAKQAKAAAEASAAPQDPNADPADPAAPAPDNVIPINGKPAVPAGEDIQKTALNGAQISSMIEIVRQVAAKEIPRESGVQLLIQSIQISQAEAEAIIGSAGQGFEPTKPEPAAPFGGGSNPPADPAEKKVPAKEPEVDPAKPEDPAIEDDQS